MHLLAKIVCRREKVEVPLPEGLEAFFVSAARTWSRPLDAFAATADAAGAGNVGAVAVFLAPAISRLRTVFAI